MRPFLPTSVVLFAAVALLVFGSACGSGAGGHDGGGGTGGKAGRAEMVPGERAPAGRLAAAAPEMLVRRMSPEGTAAAAALVEPARMAGEVVLPAAPVEGAGVVARLPRAASAAARRPAVRAARLTAASSRAGSTADSARSALAAAAADPGPRHRALVTRSAPLTRSAPDPVRCAAATQPTSRLEFASTPVFAPAAEMRPKTARVRPRFQTRSARSRGLAVVPSMSDVLRI